MATSRIAKYTERVGHLLSGGWTAVDDNSSPRRRRGWWPDVEIMRDESLVTLVAMLCAAASFLSSQRLTVAAPSAIGESVTSLFRRCIDTHIFCSALS